MKGEQISIFELIEPESRFVCELKCGSGFEGGKLRIYKAALTLPTPDLAEFLKKEYGIGGRSATFSDGSRGIVDYSPKGFVMHEYKSNTEEKHGWREVAKEIKRLVLMGEYLTEKERMLIL